MCFLQSEDPLKCKLDLDEPKKMCNVIVALKAPSTAQPAKSCLQRSSRYFKLRPNSIRNPIRFDFI